MVTTRIRMGATGFTLDTNKDGEKAHLNLGSVFSVRYDPVRKTDAIITDHGALASLSDVVCGLHGIEGRSFAAEQDHPPSTVLRVQPKKRRSKPRSHGRTYHPEPHSPPPLDAPQPPIFMM